MNLINRLGKLYDPKFDKKPPKVVLKNRKEIRLSKFLSCNSQNEILGFRAFGSHLIIKLPSTLNSKLAYLIGCILGDGCIRTPC